MTSGNVEAPTGAKAMVPAGRCGDRRAHAAVARERCRCVRSSVTVRGARSAFGVGRRKPVARASHECASSGVLAGSDLATMSRDLASEPAAGGAVGRKADGACGARGRETSRRGAVVVADPVAARRFRCFPTSHGRASRPSPRREGSRSATGRAASFPPCRRRAGSPSPPASASSRFPSGASSNSDVPSDPSP